MTTTSNTPAAFEIFDNTNGNSLTTNATGAWLVETIARFVFTRTVTTATQDDYLQKFIGNKNLLADLPVFDFIAVCAEDLDLIVVSV